jgi:hypothetical protein
MAKSWRTDISVKVFFPNTKKQYINTNVTIHFVCVTLVLRDLLHAIMYMSLSNFEERLCELVRQYENFYNPSPCSFELAVKGQ